MSQNKKIAKNTLILYIRLIATTVIGLFTSRVILLELGADDYGLYAVVGGVVMMMNFIGTSMTSTTYRFINVELGKGSDGDVNKVFNTSFIIHLSLCILLILIGETLGVWYIYNYLNVEVTRIPDALFVLQSVIFATSFSILSIPFQGLLTARENFFIRASIEIIKAVLKLGLVALLIFFTGNKLKAYSILMLIVMFAPALLLFLYCKNKYPQDVQWRIIKDKFLYKEIFNFSWWITLGALAHVGVRQGAAIILNLTFGTFINAAYGISLQVYTYVTTFVQNINQAAVPQIMKNHTVGNSKRSLDLVYLVSKFSYFIMLIIAFPILLSVDSILTLWLKDVPEFTKEFVVLMIINGLVDSVANGFSALIQATGRIKATQLWYSIILLSTLPVAYYCFSIGYSPYAISIIAVCATFLVRFIQMIILSKMTKFSTSVYFGKTIMPVLLVTVINIPQFYFVKFLDSSLIELIVTSVSSMVLVFFSIYMLGLDLKEKEIIKTYALKIQKKIYRFREV